MCLLILLLAASAVLVEKVGRWDLRAFAVGKETETGNLIYTEQPSVSNDFVS